jgi:hypothetical protein
MATEPIKVLDNLVKEAILTSYDFAWLTLAGFLIPFGNRIRCSWRAVLSAFRRLSSLTYLTLWVLLTVSVGLQAGAKLASGLAGLEKQPDATTANTILSALLITIMLDLSIRAALSSISNRRWRELYLTLARLAIANIFLGAVALMLIAGPG